MKQYKDLIKTILDEGSLVSGRNGATINIFGHTMTFYMQDGFPIPTLKQTYWKTALRELKGFTSAVDNAAGFRELGCGVWDTNANETPEWLENPYREGQGALGPVYGVQWRKWPGFKIIPIDNEPAITDAIAKGYRYVTRFRDSNVQSVVYFKKLDMLREALDAIHKSPTSRRIIFHAWNPAQLDEMALPPCHLLYQFGVDVARKRLSLNLYIRSNDIGLGAPFNIVESAFLLHLFARLTGYEPYKLSYMIGDAHIYDDQIDMCKEMLNREPMPLPTLVFSDRIPAYAETGIYEPNWLEKWSPDDVSLPDYLHHPAIAGKMRK